MRTTFFQFLTLLALVFATSAAFQHLRALAPTNTNEDEGEVLYLPSGTALQAISFGFHNALSDLLWFNTISYFGKHFRQDQNYRWLSHMCSLVTDLNSGERQIFEFCTTMLSWEAKQPERSIELLTKAIAVEPSYWKYPYLRGFTYMYFLNDDVHAQQDFAKAATLPDAPTLVAKLASRKMVANGSPEQAIEFLTEILRTTREPSARGALEWRLRQAKNELYINRLEQAVHYYNQREGHPPKAIEDLASAGIVQSDFRDPFGGKYFLNSAGEVESTASARRLIKQTK